MQQEQNPKYMWDLVSTFDFPFRILIYICLFERYVCHYKIPCYFVSLRRFLQKKNHIFLIFSEVFFGSGMVATGMMEAMDVDLDHSFGGGESDSRYVHYPNT